MMKGSYSSWSTPMFMFQQKGELWNSLHFSFFFGVIRSNNFLFYLFSFWFFNFYFSCQWILTTSLVSSSTPCNKNYDATHTENTLQRLGCAMIFHASMTRLGCSLIWNFLPFPLCLANSCLTFKTTHVNSEKQFMTMTLFLYSYNISSNSSNNKALLINVFFWGASLRSF